MKRSDGKLLRDLNPFVKVIPYVMEKRSDAQNFLEQTFCADTIDNYIKEKKEQGHSLTYMHFFIAAYVRLIAERPQLNRFVMNCQLYQRNKIFISMAIKRSLSDEGEETTVKFEFTGQENIFEIIKIIDDKIAQATTAKKNHDVDKLASSVMSMPGFIKKILVKSLKGMDYCNILPKSVIKASPFHTSLFFTYLKSIDNNYIFHHLYDFGTTGIFVALGKTVKLPIVENNEVVVKKCCQIGYVLDERICDGFYFSQSLKLFEKFLNNPHLLELDYNEKLDVVKSQ